MNPLVLVLGGARSGKSRFAVERIEAASLPRLFLATAEALDAEMEDRIRRHRAERAGPWRTIEEPLRIADVLRRETGQAILLDCLTLWLSNVMGNSPSAAIEAPIAELLDAFRERRNAVVVVSNELGSGVVPESALARAFRDAMGFLNQEVAAIADEVFLVVAGQRLRLK